MNEQSFAAQLVCDLSPDDVRLVLAVFERDVARLEGALREAAAAGDAAAFRRAAHGLAGAAGAVGALGLERACRSAMARVVDQAADLALVYDDIGAETMAAMAAMAVFLDGLNGSA